MDAPLQPHRGGATLALAILGLVPVIGLIPFGIPAWVMSMHDLKAMDAGTMDPTGRTKTLSAMVCGIVATGFWLLGIFLTVLLYGGSDAWHHA